VVSKSTRVKDEKGQRFKLHKGQKVQVIYERGAWYWVQTKNEKQAWVKKKFVRFESKKNRTQKGVQAGDAQDAPALVEVSKDNKPKAQKIKQQAPTQTKVVVSKTANAGNKDKLRVAVMDLRGTENLSANLIAFLTNTVSETLDALGPFKAISSQDIAQMLAYESSKQLLGCDDVSCLAEIGGALGADFLVSGGVSQLGELYVVQLQLTDISKAKVEARVSREHKGAAEELFAEVRAASKMLVRDILEKRAGTMALAVSEEGATVIVDGAIVGSSPMAALEMAAGLHTLSIEKEGFVVYKQDIQIAEKQTLAVTAMLNPSAEFKRSYRERADFVRTMAWLSTGLGVAALAGGGYFFYDGMQRASTLDAKTRLYNSAEYQLSAEYESIQSERQALATVDAVTLGSAGVAVAAVTSGMLLFLLGDDPGRYE
jgi:hypothetical protein